MTALEKVAINDRLGIGGNNPPSDIDAFGEKVKEKYPEMFAFADRILGAEARLPENVEDDESSGKLGDFIKQVHTAYKNLDNARESEKQVYLEGGRKVDGFFKTKYLQNLEALKKKATAINAVYLEKKRDEERRKREEEAQRLRDKQEAELKEAARLRKEAEDKRLEAEAETRRIQEEAAHREREIREKADAERKAQQAEIDRLNKEAEEKKAAQEKINTESRAQLKAAQDRLKEISREEKTEIKEVKEEVYQAEIIADGLAREGLLQERDANKIADGARRIEKQADKMEKLADASAADLARTRGVEGSLSTIKTRWVGTLTDRTKLDLEALRHFFREGDLQFAIDQFVKSNPGGTLSGAFIREETEAVVR